MEQVKTLKEKLIERAEELIQNPKTKVKGENMMQSIKEMIFLNEEEKKMVKSALMYVYDSRLDYITRNAKTLTEKEAEIISDVAGKYYKLIEKI